MTKASDNVFPRFLISEGGSTSTPAAGRVTMYAKADGLLYSKDDAGTETLVSGGTSATLKYAILQDQKAQNTAGGTFTSGAWQTRVLNTEVSDTSSIVTIASNQFTPISGTYLIRVWAPCRAVDRHQARLQNATAATTTAYGTGGYSPNSGTGDSPSPSIIETVFTANGTDAYEIQHRCATTVATNGFGVEANLGTEVYTSVVLQKL